MVDFFKEQDRARKRSKFFTILFYTIAVICSLILGVFLFYLSMYFYNILYSFYEKSQDASIADSEVYLVFMILVLPFIIIAFAPILSAIKNLSKKVSLQEKFNLQKITPNFKSDFDHKIILNIVEELSISSGIPIPEIYVNNSDNINAFVYGKTYDDAKIIVTKGALLYLSREELQGVVAHEFAHIFNGDMKLNTTTLNILKFIMILWFVGKSMLEEIGNSLDGNRLNSNIGGDILGLILVIMYCTVLITFGFPGLVFGNISKALLNRQREYMADAYAVQFTRNPNALANALKKIGAHGSKIDSQYAGEFSHLCFSNSTNNIFLSFHPPLEKRIRKLEPNWDGKFLAPTILESTKKQKAPKKETNVAKVFTTIQVFKDLQNVGNPSYKNLQKAENILSNISKNIKIHIDDLSQVKLVIYSLLLDKEQANEQIEILCDKKDIPIFKEIYRSILQMPKENYLALMQLCVSSLKNVSTEKYLIFKKNIEDLISLDNHTSMFEWCLKYLLLYPLDIYFEIKNLPYEKYSSINNIKFECSSLLSALAFAQTKDEKEAKKLFDVCKKELRMLTYIESDIISDNLLKNSLDTLQNSTAKIRKDVLEKAVLILSKKKRVDEHNNLIIHALAQALHLPMGV